MDTESRTTVMADTPSKTAGLAGNSSRIYKFIKRVFDIVASAVGLVVLSPLFLVVSILIVLDDPKGPPFFTQTRVGKDGKEFKFYKFRSMVVGAEAQLGSLMDRNEMDGPVFKIKDDPRITRVGKFIRKTSIDELPQLWNVLKGDMSIVGPRPLPTAEELACNAYQRQRELVKPGLTCYWQIAGRNNVSFKDWIELDFRYIREQSLRTDARILIKTVGAVVRGGGGILSGLVHHISTIRAGYRFTKRVFDIVASAVGLMIVSPMLLVSIAAILLEDGTSPFFFQARIGKDRKPFRMVKLRSMRVDAEQILERMSEAEKEEFSRNFKLKNDSRITKVGHFIRKTSIDELPQLWNVLRGDMSIVGPRPPLLVEEEAYGEHLTKVMSVRPGITGYWQVHGRSETDFSERIELNEYYIEHRSIWLDLKILLATIGVVIGGKGAV